MSDAIKVGHRKTEGRCEIVRSFSYKMNAGNFESRDFFCSQKCECDVVDAEDISETLYQFCKSQVLKSVTAYKRDMSTNRMPEQRAS